MSWIIDFIEYIAQGAWAIVKGLSLGLWRNPIIIWCTLGLTTVAAILLVVKKAFKR